MYKGCMMLMCIFFFQIIEFIFVLDGPHLNIMLTEEIVLSINRMTPIFLQIWLGE